MCGIVGFYRINRKATSPAIEDVVSAFEECSDRGKQATGFFSPTTGVIKDDDIASKFCEDHRDELEVAVSDSLLLGHCRAATTGFRGYYATPSKNENNHPHEGKRYILVHNGCFSELPIVKGYKYAGECDSELALSYIETFGLKRGLEMMYQYDTYSLVIFDKESGHMHFYRRSNPLVFALSPDGMLLFGSTSQIVVNLCKEIKTFGFQTCNIFQCFNTTEEMLYTVARDKGLIERVEIKPRQHNTRWSEFPEAKQLDVSGFEKSKIREFVSRTTHQHPGGHDRHRESVNRFSEPLQRDSEPYFDEVFVSTLDGQITFCTPLSTNGDSTLFN